MQKIEKDVTVTIEENGALAEVRILAFELNDIRRERKEYLAQTASDLYDRIVYMVRANGLEYDPALDESDEGPLVSLTVNMDVFSMSTAFWMEDRRERQNRCMSAINECFEGVLRMKKNLDDVIYEEDKSGR